MDDDVILMNELGLLGGSSSKTTDVAKETSDQATSPIEIDSNTTLDISENVDNSQIQRPICEKCSEEISIEFSKDIVFLSCKHTVVLPAITKFKKFH